MAIVGSLPAAEKDDWYAKAVKSVEATVEPAEAKPGQTVKFKLTVKLNEGFYTYPLKQVDAKAKAMVNKITFPTGGSLIFVGEAIDPMGFDAKKEPLLEIEELRTYKESVTFERMAVVSPNAKPGAASVKLDSFKLSICDATNCFPTKTLTPEAKWKVLEGRVEVAKEFAEEVKKSLENK